MSKKPKKTKKKRLSIFRILFELIILYLFSGLMFNLGYITGIFYLLAITMAIVNGVLFRKKGIAWMIILGTILTFFAGRLAISTLNTALAGDLVSAGIFLVVALFIWKKGRKLKKGEK